MTDSRSALRLPNELTHYYRRVSQPFQSLSDVSPSEAADIIDILATKEQLPRRLTTPHYLPQRRKIEQTMREQFVAKGGRPQRTNPYYLILGKWSHWEEDRGCAAVTIPLDSLSPDVISFTYPDSWVSFVGEMLSGEELPRFPYHRQVYRLDELDSLVAEYGLPGERWRTEEDRRMETYIEAEVWTDEIIQPALLG